MKRRGRHPAGFHEFAIEGAKLQAAHEIRHLVQGGVNRRAPDFAFGIRALVPDAVYRDNPRFDDDMAADMVDLWVRDGWTIREIADAAEPYGVRVVIYPHVKNWTERLSDAVRVEKKVDRKNVGVMFNLCHCLKVDDPPNLRRQLEAAMPLLPSTASRTTSSMLSM